ncbi:sensor histidine kinase regulating citrate/malate metabolism [Lachnospiraceae bacterium PM6-15]|uniref:ATP-binding protein n=1 Tax=Ohessyouella blattaphilus TaxID=2949333 RepID=UPI003E2558FD
MQIIEVQLAENDKADNLVKEMKHNYVNDLLSIKSHISRNDLRQANALINRLTHNLDKPSFHVASSGNIFLDSIINNKYIVMKMRSIRFELELLLPAETTFRGSDLILIVGNLLDNAIEATSHLEIESRFIRLKIKFVKSNLKIEICNTYKGKLNRSSTGKLISSKRNKSYHGLGMQMIEQAVCTYQGDMNIDTKDNVFIVKVLLYSPSELLHEDA